MEYSFKILKEEFEKIGITLNTDKIKDLKLIDEENNITETGILLSDKCNHNIKIITYDTDIIEKSFSGSLLYQYHEIRNYLVNLELSKFYPLDIILEALINAIVHRDNKYKGDI